MKKKNSYVCTLSTDDYIDGVLVLNENLNMVNSKYSLLCLIDESTSEHTKSVLDLFNIEYDYMNSNYDILNVFNLTDYSKIVYLDASLLIFRNIDNLFKEKSISMTKDYTNQNNLFHTGVMVIEPNKDDYNNLIKIKDKDNKSSQIIINEYFNNINELDIKYNIQKEIEPGKYVDRYYNYTDKDIPCVMVKNYCDGLNKNKDATIINYCGYVKPFMLKGIYDCEGDILYLHFLNKVLDKKKRVNYEKDLISVIIPVYNQEKYLDNCLNSVLNQTYKNIEVILINDGSTDKSLEIMQKYQEKDNRIKIINIPNQGVSHARNTGLDIAKGKYITFIDSDDTFEKNALQILYYDLVDNNVDIVQCNNYMDKDPLLYTNYNCKLEGQYNLFHNFILEYIGCTIWGKLYKSDLLKDIRFNEKYNNHEDELFSYEVIKKANSIFFEKDILYYYTWKKENSLTEKKLSQKDTELFISLFNNLLDDILNNYPDLLPYFKRFIKVKLFYLKKIKKDLSINDFDFANTSNIIEETINDYLSGKTKI